MTQQQRIARYEAAYLAANGHPIRVQYERARYRCRRGGYSGSVFTGPELDRATLALEARATQESEA